MSPHLVENNRVSPPGHSADSQILRKCWGRLRCWRLWGRKWGQLCAYVIQHSAPVLYVDGEALREWHEDLHQLTPAYPDRWNQAPSENHAISSISEFWATNIWNHWQLTTLLCISGGWSSWATVGLYGWILPSLAAVIHDEWNLPVSCDNRSNGCRFSQRSHRCVLRSVTGHCRPTSSALSLYNSLHIQFRIIFWITLSDRVATQKRFLNAASHCSMDQVKQDKPTSKTRCPIVFPPHNTQNHRLREMARTGQAATELVLQSTYWSKVLFSLVSYCVI
jgi:hypothetical protein